MNHWEIRQKIIDQCLYMNSSGLNQGTSGNISVRYKDYMIITPSGVPYDQLSPGDLCRMSLNHDRYEWRGDFKPSSEWHFHRSILQSDNEYGAVIHTHSTYATVLSIARESIPPCHYMIAAFGGNDVRCADYALFGSEELSNNILNAMRGRSACLMGNHGMVVAGANLDKAMWAAVELETLSKQYYLARQLNNLTLLNDAEMADVHEGFRRYAGKAQSADDGTASDGTANSGAANDGNNTSNSTAKKGSNNQPRVNLPKQNWR